MSCSDSACILHVLYFTGLEKVGFVVTVFVFVQCFCGVRHASSFVVVLFRLSGVFGKFREPSVTWSVRELCFDWICTFLWTRT